MSEVIDFQEVPKFDPTKKYTWKQDAQIILTGGEFGVVLNAMRAIAEATGIAQTASQVVEGALVRSVESGIIVEVKD
jgi:hypothetical protein